MNLFNLTDKYGKELKCPNTYDKYPSLLKYCYKSEIEVIWTHQQVVKWRVFGSIFTTEP